MKKLFLVANLLLVLLVPATSMARTDVFLNSGIGIPAPVFVAPAPVVVAPPPPPVFVAPVVVYPPTVVIQPAPVIIGSLGGMWVIIMVGINITNIIKKTIRVYIKALKLE